ncbi:MAG: hypothetical protein HY553_16465 [Elusimicrobia bacterium]|nr:hypothetical protein [Elusimicrobiota bacterium]
MNLMRMERIALILGLGILSAANAGAQVPPSDGDFILRDAGELGGALGQLGDDVKAVYDTETGQLVGFVAEQGGRFVTFTVDAAQGAGKAVGGFFDNLGRTVRGLQQQIGRAIDEHNPYLRKVGQDFVDINDALVALDRDLRRARKRVVGDGVKLVGEGMVALGELIADRPKGPVRHEGCDGPIAMDGQSLWCQDLETINGFVETWGSDAAERWAWEHSKDLEDASWRTVAYGWN